MNARETADDYAGTLVEFGGWRIVRCKDDIQWIVQKDRRRGELRISAGPWEVVAYRLDGRCLAVDISGDSVRELDMSRSVLLSGVKEQGTALGVS